MAKKLSSYHLHDTNPSHAALRKYARFGFRTIDASKSRPVSDTETGEVMFLNKGDNTETILKDVGEFTKLFAPAKEKLIAMGMPGKNLFFYLTTIVNTDMDWVRIDIPLAMKGMGYESRNAVYDGIFELLDAKFLFRKLGDSGTYFINVEYFFNGKRTNLSYFSELKDRLKSGKIDITKFNKEDSTD